MKIINIGINGEYWDSDARKFMVKKISVEKHKLSVFPTRDITSNLFTGSRLEYTPERESLAPFYHKYRSYNLFFNTVHKCFEEHLSLVLKPEVLMHLIIDTIAKTVNEFSQDYRDLFTKSADNIHIHVADDSLVMGGNTPWTNAVTKIGSELNTLVPSDVMKLMLPEFSTHTITSRVAGMVTFMSAAQKFYSYGISTACGIPQVILLGTPADYEHLLNSAKKLSALFSKHLSAYFSNLIPVLEKLHIESKSDIPDNEFWSSIYKYYSMSGTSDFDGWISNFLLYVMKGKGISKRENLDEVIATGTVPCQINSAPFSWNYYGVNYNMRLVSGVMNVKEFEGGLLPELSYAVIHEAKKQ